MKPKTQIQKKIVAMSAKLPPIDTPIKEWAIKKVVKHYAIMRKKVGTTCLDCGHTWPIASTGKTKCPNCGRTLHVLPNGRYRMKKEETLFQVVSTFKGFQVIRIFNMFARYELDHKPDYGFVELAQTWAKEDLKPYVLSLSRTLNGAISYSSELEFRCSYNHVAFISAGKTYPRARVLPLFKRNGYHPRIEGNQFELLKLICDYPSAETLIKAGQNSLLSYMNSTYQGKVSREWASVKICIRNKYIVKDASLWLDYIDLLRHYNFDLRNAKYVCPDDLLAAHNRLHKKRQKEVEEQRRREREAKLKRDMEALQQFQERIAKFADVEIVQDEINIRPLLSVDEFHEEGNEMHHCVFTGEYYKKKNCLILSAKVSDERAETIEVDLTRFKVLQCRGKYNRPTEHHDRILQVLQDNMHVIAQAV